MPDGGYEAWVGRTETRAERFDPWSIGAMAATLDDDALTAAAAGGGEIPPVLLWLAFRPSAPMREVGPDGHPKRGGFLPPVDLPRRMWAGSRCRFHAPVRAGDQVERVSTIAKVAAKDGKAGPMVFVTVAHEVTAEGVRVMSEEQDIVYMRIPERFVAPEPIAPPPADWSEPRPVDPVFLFRFSALTFNGHRIHYDRTYATDVERYPGLVVHGPLQALLLFEAGRRHAGGRTPASFDFRGVRPVFDHDALALAGRARPDGGLELWTDAGGATGMQATMTFAG